MTKYIIEIDHNEDGVSVTINDLDPDTMAHDRAAIEMALKEALRISREHSPQRFQ